MEWLELNIDTSHAGLDAVTDMLEQQGVTGLIIDDEADFQSFLENNRQYWDYVDEELLEQKKGVCRVTFYLERNEAAYGTVAAGAHGHVRPEKGTPGVCADAADHGGCGGRRLGEQLEAVLQAHGDRAAACWWCRSGRRPLTRSGSSWC